MKNTAIALLLTFSFVVSPAPALAQTDTGPTPGSFWYGVTTTFENVNLFFTFNNEKKAEKALTYAERRLAQAKAAAETENTGAVETALADYEAKLTLATESSKKIDNDERAEKLLTSIADNTAKHQETLSAVLEKVPEEARQAITKAIEASKRGQEEATKQIAELKGEVERLKQEVAELKIKDKEREQKIEELSKQKTESSVIQPKTKTVAPQAQTAPTQKTETTQSQTATKTNTITLPNGAVVEMDANGNIIRTIKEAPNDTTYTSPVSHTSVVQSQSEAKKNEISTKEPDYSIRVSQPWLYPSGVLFTRFSDALDIKIRNDSSGAPRIVKITARLLVPPTPFLNGYFSKIADAYLQSFGVAKIGEQNWIIVDKTWDSILVPPNGESEQINLNFLSKAQAEYLISQESKYVEMRLHTLTIFVDGGKTYEVVFRPSAW